jgi:hypothetical protein
VIGCFEGTILCFPILGRIEVLFGSSTEGGCFREGDSRGFSGGLIVLEMINFLFMWFSLSLLSTVFDSSRF